MANQFLINFLMDISFAKINNFLRIGGGGVKLILM